LAWLTTGAPLERAARCLLVLTGFSIPLSTSLSEISTSLFLCCWLCSGDWRAKWGVIRANLVALWSLVLFGLLLVGTTWSTEAWGAAGRCLLKYREFLYLPMFLIVFRDAALRRLAVSAFLLAVVMVLGLSYTEWLTGADYGYGSSPHDFLIGKDRINHGLIMAFAAFLAVGRMTENLGRTAVDGRRAWAWAGSYAMIFVFAIHNELCMSTGRTGYVVLAGLVCVFLAELLGRRGLAIAGLVLAISGMAVVNSSSTIHDRVSETIGQLQQQWDPSRTHSTEPRLEFYANACGMIARHPWLGTGTGSFAREYARQVAGSDDRLTRDPHNEYLCLASQVGIPGALLFVGLLAFQWLAAVRLPVAERSIGRGVVATIALGSLFNSLILGITGGLIYSYFSALAFADLVPVVHSASAPDIAPTAAVGKVATKQAA
jgi:O-antigen ligase